MSQELTTAGTARIDAAVAKAFSGHLPGGGPAAVALSGGRDSVVMFDAAARLAAAHNVALSAIHVHHGLSPNAEAWANFCSELCAARGLPLTICRLDIPRPRASVEAMARTMRYAAIATAAANAGIAHVLLAHHRDDQAETLLLQLLRGAGPQGLAAMPEAASDDSGIAWLRPLLAVARASIDECARVRDVRWVDDESNASPVHRRNALRLGVVPALEQVFPAWAATLSRAAVHQAGAAELLDDLAVIDAGIACADATLDRSALAALSEARAANLLRWFLRSRGLLAPSTARLAAMLAQLRSARPDASVRVLHQGLELGVRQGRIVVHPPPVAPFDIGWSGEGELTLPHGRLAFVRASGAGIDAFKLDGAPVRICSRRGGERFQLAPDRPRRALKSILQEAGVAPWERCGLPLVYCGSELAAVGGIGIDAAFSAAPGHPGVVIDWVPRSA